MKDIERESCCEIENGPFKPVIYNHNYSDNHNRSYVM